MSSLYPDHFSALKSAGLCTEDLPSVTEVVEKFKAGRSSAKEKKALCKKAACHQTFFCIRYSTLWRYPIHRSINKACHKYKLTWLCPSMSYHAFANLGTKLNADTASKLMALQPRTKFQG